MVPDLRFLNRRRQSLLSFFSLSFLWDRLNLRQFYLVCHLVINSAGIAISFWYFYLCWSWSKVFICCLVIAWNLIVDLMLREEVAGVVVQIVILIIAIEIVLPLANGDLRPKVGGIQGLEIGILLFWWFGLRVMFEFHFWRMHYDFDYFNYNGLHYLSSGSAHGALRGLHQTQRAEGNQNPRKEEEENIPIQIQLLQHSAVLRPK